LPIPDLARSGAKGPGPIGPTAPSAPPPLGTPIRAPARTGGGRTIGSARQARKLGTSNAVWWSATPALSRVPRPLERVGSTACNPRRRPLPGSRGPSPGCSGLIGPIPRLHRRSPRRAHQGTRRLRDVTRSHQPPVGRRPWPPAPAAPSGRRPRRADRSAGEDRCAPELDPPARPSTRTVCAAEPSVTLPAPEPATASGSAAARPAGPGPGQRGALAGNSSCRVGRPARAARLRSGAMAPVTPNAGTERPQHDGLVGSGRPMNASVTGFAYPAGPMRRTLGSAGRVRADRHNRVACPPSRQWST
jgi:hypothetical protein